MLRLEIEQAIERGGEVGLYSDGIKYNGIPMSADNEYLKIVTFESNGRPKNNGRFNYSTEWIIRISSITGFSSHLTDWDANRLYRIEPDFINCDYLTGNISDPFKHEDYDDDDDDDDDDQFEIFFA